MIQVSGGTILGRQNEDLEVGLQTRSQTGLQRFFRRKFSQITRSKKSTNVYFGQIRAYLAIFSHILW